MTEQEPRSPLEYTREDVLLFQCERQEATHKETAAERAARESRNRQIDEATDRIYNWLHARYFERLTKFAWRLQRGRRVEDGDYVAVRAFGEAFETLRRSLRNHVRDDFSPEQFFRHACDKVKSNSRRLADERWIEGSGRRTVPIDEFGESVLPGPSSGPSVADALEEPDPVGAAIEGWCRVGETLGQRQDIQEFIRVRVIAWRNRLKELRMTCAELMNEDDDATNQSLYEEMKELYVERGNDALERGQFDTNWKRAKEERRRLLYQEIAAQRLADDVAAAVLPRDALEWVPSRRAQRAKSLAKRVSRDATSVTVLKGSAKVERALRTLALHTAAVLELEGYRTTVVSPVYSDRCPHVVPQTVYIVLDAPGFDDVEAFLREAARTDGTRVLAVGASSDWTRLEARGAPTSIEILTDDAPGLVRVVGLHESPTTWHAQVEARHNVAEVIETVALAHAAGIATPLRFLERHLGVSERDIKEIATAASWEIQWIDGEDPGDTRLRMGSIQRAAQLVDLWGNRNVVRPRYEKLLRSALTSFPDHARRVLAGLVLKGRASVAAQLVHALRIPIEDAVTQNDLPVRHQTSWVRTLRDVGAHDLALKIIAKALEKYSGNIHLLHLQANIFARQGKHRQAVEAFEALRRLDPQNPYVRVAWADMERERRDYETAGRLYSEALRLDGGNIHARIGLATLLVQQRKTDAALQVLSPLLDQKKPNLCALVTLSEARLAVGQIRVATEAIERALEIDQYSVVALTAAGTLAKQRGHRARAAHYLERALDIVGESLYALTSLADLRIQQLKDGGHHREMAEELSGAAEALIERCRAIDDAAIQTRTVRANYFLARQHAGGARAALADMPDEEESPFVLTLRARIHVLEGDKGGARELLQRAAAHEGPSIADALTETAHLEERDGNAAAARALFKTANEADHLNVVTLTAWAEFEVRAGDRDAAGVLLDKAETLDPENVYVLRAKASLHEHRGEAAEAERLRERASALETAA